MNAAALGEYDHGAGKGNDSMLMMTIGTGTGGTVVIQGDVYHGYSRSAGETGYMWVDGYHFRILPAQLLWLQIPDGAPLDHVFITSTFEQAKAVIEAGADILGFLQKFLCFFIS